MRYLFAGRWSLRRVVPRPQRANPQLVELDLPVIQWPFVPDEQPTVHALLVGSLGRTAFVVKDRRDVQLDRRS